ncbi:MAG: hypothetical protein HQL68_12705, partial [Magnetococcales bacterium]|nr:hypothetical protein [Magnetococcales bacterium]
DMHEDSDVIPLVISMVHLEKNQLIEDLAAGELPFANATNFADTRDSGTIQSQMMIKVYDVTTGTIALPAAFTLTKTSGGDGALDVGTGTCVALCYPDATTGEVHLDLTDVGGASGKTLLIEARMLLTPGGSFAATAEFD